MGKNRDAWGKCGAAEVLKQADGDDDARAQVRHQRAKRHKQGAHARDPRVSAHGEGPSNRGRATGGAAQ